MNRYNSMLAGMLMAVLPAMGRMAPAVAEEVTPVALQAEQGDLLGAIATYREQYDPATTRGLVALRQLAIQVLRLGLRLSDPHERNG